MGHLQRPVSSTGRVAFVPRGIRVGEASVTVSGVAHVPGRMARAVEAATAAGVQGDLMTRRDEFTNHAQSWRRAAVGAGATLVGWLRESASYDPRFAFVALDGDRIVGHVATGGDLDGAPTLGLGPLSVEPSRQGQGIGS